jgi:pimeloyl-ACP methyl ester carboxylesterase
MDNLQTSSGYVDVSGARLYYEVAGAGRPLVMVHAGIANLHMWDDQVPAFAERFRVIRYDARGYGKTEGQPDHPWALHEDLRSVMDALNLDRAHLVGCSMGGQTILDFALTNPERVAALIPVGSGLSGYKHESEEGKRFGTAIEDAFQRGDIDTAIEVGTQLWVDGPSRPSERVNPAMRARAKEMLAQAFRAPDYVEPTPIEPSAVSRLGEIAAPTLVVLGENDVEDIQRICRLLASEIRSTRLEVIADAAHLPNMDHPDRFNRLVLEFVGGQ